jgi:predicted nucleic acid-binding protein
MTGPCFVDTNVVVYADDVDAGAKCRTARALLGRLFTDGTAVVSIQVLQEYFSAATRRLGLPAAAARQRVEALGRLDVVRLAADDVLAAIDLHRLHGLSIWDALVVRAALVSGCRTLYSEDLQHGRRFEALEVVDPFAE